MQKPAPTTQNRDITSTSSSKNLERGRNAQPRRRNHPFHGSTSSHGRRYKDSPIPTHKLGKRRSHPWISLAYSVRTTNSLERRNTRQTTSASSHILNKTRRNTRIKCDHGRPMGDDERRPG